MQKEKLTIKQERAILGLIEHGTIEAAAKKTKISKTTIRKYHQNPLFIDELRKRRYDVFNDALDRLRALIGTAVDRLTTLLNSDDETIQRLTAKIVLDSTFKGVEIHDFEDRLSRIEEIIKDKFFVS